jgi:predicted MFS family arabinose efflux permease
MHHRKTSAAPRSVSLNLVSGIAMLLASVLAGLLWDRWGAPATVYAGAAFSALALAGLFRHRMN